MCRVRTISRKDRAWRPYRARSVASCPGLRWAREASCSCVADATGERDAFGSQPPSTSRSATARCWISSGRPSSAARSRRAGDGGWYWEVNRLSDLSDRIVPFFDRFPVVGQKAEEYRLWRSAVGLLSSGRLNDQDYAKVLALRERMNRGGKRRYRMHGILRDYTPSSQA